MSSSYDICETDKGWFMIADTNHGGGVCSYETNLPGLPAFIYSSLNTRGSPNGIYLFLLHKNKTFILIYIIK